MLHDDSDHGSADTEPRAQDQRRTQILDAARACFAVSGFHGASMHQICAEAKMSPGALYRYFPSKDAIIEAIADDERGKASAVMANFRREGPLVDRIVGCALDYLSRMESRHSGALMVEICSESLRNSAIGERFHCTELDVRNELLEAVRVAQRTGEIPASVDAEMAILMLFSVTDGLVMRMGLEPALTPASAEPFYRRVVAALLGLSVPPQP